MGEMRISEGAGVGGRVIGRVMYAMLAVLLTQAIAQATPAYDGLTLETQDAETIARFRSVWGDDADAEWVRERNRWLNEVVSDQMASAEGAPLVERIPQVLWCTKCVGVNRDDPTDCYVPKYDDSHPNGCERLIETRRRALEWQSAAP